MNNFIEGKDKVFTFMDNLRHEKEHKDQVDAFKNSTDYKLGIMDRCKADARGKCLDNICCKIYRDSLPFNDDYKNANIEDIDAAWREFISKRCPKGVEFYIKEGLKKGSPFAKKVLEAVDELVDDHYRDMEVNPDKYDPNELEFKCTDDIQKKLDIINDDISEEELTDAISNNVKSTVASEINRAKLEKERINNLEKELANDVRVNTPEAIESALEAAGITETKFYEPSLFEAINIGMMKKLQPRYESGELQDVYLYNTLSVFKENIDETSDIHASLDDLAFVESVKELTALNVVKALKLENLNPIILNDIKYDYVS